MGRVVHDWDKLKKEYILGDEPTVKGFMEKNDIPIGTYNNRTTGWTDERQKYWNQSTEEIVEEFVNSKAGKEQIRRLLKAKELVYDSVIERLKTNNQKLPMKEIKTAWEMIQTELGLTTSIRDQKIDHTTDGEKLNSKITVEILNSRDESQSD